MFQINILVHSRYLAQALERAGGSEGHKGKEAVDTLDTALAMTKLVESLNLDTGC